jgi:signal transduction histidine kinase
MRQMEQTAGWGGAERKRVEAVVETLATVRGEGENLAEVAHDTRNMVTALALYCDLLEEPGVLAAPYLHYGSELRLVAAASRRLVERLVALDRRGGGGAATSIGSAREKDGTPAKTAPIANPSLGDRLEQCRQWDLAASKPIANLANELLANRNLLAALTGPSIALTVDAEGGARPVWLTGEDLTRLLVNLVKNAAEAMPEGGRIQLGLRERAGQPGAAASLTLTIDDNGPGIPEKALESIFESGYTSRTSGSQPNGRWPSAHRGLGLAITRSIVEGAGGRIRAENLPSHGARFQIEMPVRSR